MLKRVYRDFFSALLYDKDTFDGGYASTIHVNSSLYDDYIKDSKWGGTFKNVVGDLVDGETISLTDFTVNGIKYKMVSSDRVAVTYPNASKPGSSNINEYSGDIVVPSKVTYQGKTYYVRGIADYAFRFASNVNSITLPEGLIYIGEEAIYNANTISKLTVPNTVRTLRKYALAENSSLTKVTFGENIANNKWGKWVCWRESGAYDVYMICDTKPELPDDYTFDDSHASTIHVKSANESDYTADSKWNNQTISGDLSDGFCDLKSAITTNKSILTDEVGTEPGYYTAASTTDLNTAIDAAEALTTSATASEISSAIDDMTTARASLAVSPLTEGYYFIENTEKKQMIYAEAAYAAEGCLGFQDLDESKAKFYFRLTKKGSNWYMKCVKNNLYAGKPVNGNSVNEYITLTEDPEFEQVITYVSPGKFKIQSLYDGVNASYPYSVSGGWVLLSSSENNRTCWYFHPATIGEDVNGILTAEEVGNKVSNAVSNGDSYLDFSSYCLVSEYLISNMPASSNLLVKVASDSGITGTNIVNNSVCSSLVLTDGQPFGYYKDFTATSASYSRSVANTFGTICLPFAVSSDENVQYYTLNYIDGSTLYLTKADNVDAGAPAVFEMKNGTTLNASATDAEVKGSVVNPVDGSLKLMGTFDGETITTNLANSYYIRNNQFHKATNSITVAPFRAYFTTTGSEAKAFNFCTEENETAIDNVQCSMLNVQCVYDANGMKLQSLRKGLNIVKMNNGNVQKVVVK